MQRVLWCVYCRVLPCVAVWCSVLQCAAASFYVGTLDSPVVICCSVYILWQCISLCCSSILFVAREHQVRDCCFQRLRYEKGMTERCTARCSVCSRAVCCGVMQKVMLAYCSALQRAAVCY